MDRKLVLEHSRGFITLSVKGGERRGNAEAREVDGRYIPKLDLIILSSFGYIDRQHRSLSSGLIRIYEFYGAERAPECKAL